MTLFNRSDVVTVLDPSQVPLWDSGIAFSQYIQVVVLTVLVYHAGEFQIYSLNSDQPNKVQVLTLDKEVVCSVSESPIIQRVNTLFVH